MEAGVAPDKSVERLLVFEARVAERVPPALAARDESEAISLRNTEQHHRIWQRHLCSRKRRQGDGEAALPLENMTDYLSARTGTLGVYSPRFFTGLLKLSDDVQAKV